LPSQARRRSPPGRKASLKSSGTPHRFAPTKKPHPRHAASEAIARDNKARDHGPDGAGRVHRHACRRRGRPKRLRVDARL
jgi:hypothetical protein